MLLIYNQGHFSIVSVRGELMNELLRKYMEYMRLEHCKAEYILSNGEVIDVFFLEENFAHLIGLHKLKDIQLIQFWLDKSNKRVKMKEVIRRIKNSTFTDAMVKASIFYPQIKERYENFSYDNVTTLTYTDAIIHFNPQLIKSKIKSDYILLEEKGQGEYNHLGIALDKKRQTRYLETFFHQPDNRYIAGQILVKVNGFKLFGANNQLITEDHF